MGLGQLFEIKPRCCRGSLLRDELGLRRFETQNDLTRSFPRVPAGTLGRLGSPNLTQAGRYFRGNLWPSAISRKVMKIVHKPVALAWRQRASSALRARAAATLPPAFMNNSHDFCPTRHKDTGKSARAKRQRPRRHEQLSEMTLRQSRQLGRDNTRMILNNDD
jgi:hypothetical protein